MRASQRLKPMGQDDHKRMEEAEAKARYYQAHYASLANQIPNAMFVLDVEADRIVELNKAACDLLGYTDEELRTSVRISDVHPHEIDDLQQFSAEAYKNGTAHTERLSCMTATGRCVPVRIHATVFENTAGRPLIRAIIVDNLAKEAMELALLDEIKAGHDFDEIIGKSKAFEKAIEQVRLVASTDAPVLILGETGTGKELICRAIHHASRRGNKPVVKVNCAAIPAGLVASVLFGHERGAFSGAFAQKRGRFELAHGGTMFLDEIGDLPLEIQPKLLRVLQEQEFERLGGARTIKINTRLIAATHHNLAQMVKEGDFREDLFYRLYVFPITLPPLRDRKEDIALLAEYIAHRANSRYGRAPCRITEGAMRLMLSYHWPGNVRELQNVIERAVILSVGGMIDREHIQVEPVREAPREAPPAGEGPIGPLRAVERAHILRALQATNWKVSGKGGAAGLLALKPTTLQARMKKLGIARDQS